MNKVSVQDLLDRLETEPHVVELLSGVGPDVYPELWNDSSAASPLYAHFAQALNAQGHPAKALDLARKGLAQLPKSADLHYQVALAHARGGNLSMAEQALARLLDSTATDMRSQLDAAPAMKKRVYALRGRLYKDACFAAVDTITRGEWARKAAAWYDQAAHCEPNDAFPRINHATLLRVSGEVDESRRAGRDIYSRLQTPTSHSDDAQALSIADDWREATLAEAALLADEIPLAIQHYEAAVDRMLGERRIGDLISVLKNLRLLAQAGAIEEPSSLRDRLGSIVVFSGHRIDPLDWPTRQLPPRFPNDSALARTVQAAIRKKLNAMNARFGFCSLACGSDILFAEEMLARDAELDVVLPFQRDDFVTHCVDYGQSPDSPMQTWRRRFEAILDRITPQRLHFATEEPHLGADMLFDYTNQFLQGLAKVRAAQCLLEPIALVVIDEQAIGQQGGAKSFQNSWLECGYPLERIDLAMLRPARGIAVPPSQPMPLRVQPKLNREVRAMLFADVAGFSHLREELAPDFFLQFPRVIAEVLGRHGSPVLSVNTWGDGFFAVFDSAPSCATFALELLDCVGRAIPWRAWGFAEENPLRVGVHTGPVFVLEHDPVLKRLSFCGQHINRTARIEPVTVPGCVFASEQFAALLSIAAGDRFRCDLVGTEQLAKKYASAALYRICSVSDSTRSISP